MSEISKSSIDQKSLFMLWLNEHPIKEYSSSAIVEALDEGSHYCVSRKICKENFWSTKNKTEFNSAAMKLLSQKFFRLIHRNVATTLQKAVPLYEEFLEYYNVVQNNPAMLTLDIELNQEQISTQPASDRNKLYEKLYSISQIYDDPTGLSLDKIIKLIGRDARNEDVQDILDQAPWSHKIADGVYSFAITEASPTGNRGIVVKKGAISDSAFYCYLDKTLGMAEPTCKSYVSAIHSAETFAQDHGFESWHIYDTASTDAISLINALMEDESFVTYNLHQHNRFRAAFKKFVEMSCQSVDSKTTDEKKLEDSPLAGFDQEKYIDTLMCRYRNGITFDSIDFDNFRETYENRYGRALDVDDATLEKQLHHCGVFYNGRLYPVEGIMDDEVKEKLFAYIENSFSSGKKVLYYKAIFEDFADVFANCYTLADEKMLHAFIEFTADKGKYFFFKDYMSTEPEVEIDNTAEVEVFLLSAGKPMKVEEVCTALTHIPEDKVDSIIKSDSRFRRNSKGEYFHADIFEVSEIELTKIAEIIDRYINENEYAIWTDVWNEIQDTLPVFLENNLYLSALGVRNAISQHYEGKFYFNGAVISHPQDCYEMRDVYQLYAKHHPTFTADDIYNLSKKLDTVIYFEALSGVSVRVSHDLFVSKNQISFDVEAVDRAIGSFLSKDYIRIREIDSYLIFPNVGYEWNEYLLESFLLSYSKKFVLVNNGLSLNNVAGFVVKKDGRIKEFVDACADFLADGNVELNKASALSYLADTDVISRRSYKDINLALRQAAQIRSRKE